MPTLLAFGDSNTHGTPPLTQRGVALRYGPDVRWPSVTGAALGPDWTVVEEGLPGRTAQCDDPVMGAFMNGQVGLRIALQSHGPIDVLSIMLGTNDAKTRFAPTPQRVTAGMAGLLDIALSDEMQSRHGGFAILLICPPAVVETGILAGEFMGAARLFRDLPASYAALAKGRGVGFLDAGRIIAVSGTDGVHFEPDAHIALGQAVAGAVRSLVD
ncbi:MAG: GDSL-type esterase/lipase family protein [Paracoccaceae bacterium]